MKKYLAAAVVALMVFAFSAFAATLSVDAGNLQAGQDNVDRCADSVTLDYGTDVGGDGQFYVHTITLSFDEAADCDGNFAYLAIFDHEVPPAGGSNIIGFGIDEIQDDEAVFTTDGDVEEIVGVSVMVKNTDDSGGSGFTDGIITSAANLP